MNGNVATDDVRWNPYKKQYVKKAVQSKMKKKHIQTTLPLSDVHDDAHRWIGDDMSDPPDKAHTRVLLHNCNSLSKYLHDANLIHSIMRIWRDMHFHIIGLTETRINSSNPYLYDLAKNTYSQIFENGEIRFANSPKFNSKACSQPGGVGVAINGRIQQRFVTSGRDTLGRWAWVQFAGKNSAFRVYSFYRVNNNSDQNTGHTTAWCQQREHLLNLHVNTNPRSQAITDLIAELEAFIEAGHNVLLLADLNESITGPEKTNQKFRDIGLVNIMEHRIGTRLPLTHIYGSTAVDHMWGTCDVIDSVRQAGFAPFHYIGESDHRALIMDIDIKGILDSDIEAVKQKHQRRLKMNAPKRVLKYCAYVEKSWKHHNIRKRVNDLSKNFRTNGITDDNILRLNRLDQQISEIMNAGEKRCTKMDPRNQDTWSVKLDTAAKAVYDLRYQLRKLRSVECGQTEDLKEQIDEVNTALTVAKEKYKQTKRDHKKHRNEHLDSRAKYNIDHNGAPDITKEIKAIKHIEEQIRIATKIGYVLKPRQFDANSGILIPDLSEYSDVERSKPNFNHMCVSTIWDRIEVKNGKDIGRWERVTQKTKVHQLLVAWQCKHFAQSSSTPFVTDDWSRILMNKDVQKEIINGSYTPPESLYPLAKVYLHYLKRDASIDTELPFTIKFERFCQFISKAKEKTSCSPSGRTYSHYKALLLHQKSSLKDIFYIMDMAITYSIVLDRWKRVTTTLLLKDAGQPKIHRMRTIHIIEAELQFVSKHIYVQQMMYNAEKKRLITDEQYGGRKFRQAQSAVLNKVLYGNISLQTRVSWACMDDDARACYDRILPCLSAVEGRKWGLSYDEAVFTTKVLHQQIFSIRTSTGITTETYSYSLDNPIQGAGQGIGWAGPKWINTSDTISRIMNDRCPGMKFTDPYHTICVVKVADFFIDDTATGTNSNAIPEGDSVLEHLRTTEQLHADLLFVSGHRLALDKCAYYVIHFRREGFQYQPLSIEESPGTLTLRDAETDKLVQIKRLEPDMAHRSLGIHIAPSGRQIEQFKILREKIKEWADRVKTSSLQGRERLAAYDAYIEKAILHIVSATNFTLKQCRSLAKIISPILLNAHGIQRNCARIVLYSTLNTAGLNVTHVYHLQGLEKLRFFFTHMRRGDTTGELMMISLLYTQLELGISKKFLKAKYDTYRDYATPTWITNLWEYCDKCGVTIDVMTQHMYQLPRSNDFFLMDVIYNAVHNMEHIHIFNHVRIALKLYSASDIVALGSGSHILPNILAGINHRTSTMAWPNSDQLPKRWIHIWESLLISIIQPILHAKPLGEWIAPTHQRWRYFTTEQKLAISDSTTTYIKTSSTRGGNYVKTDASIDAYIPCDVLITGNDTLNHVGSSLVMSQVQNPRQHKSHKIDYNNINDWRKRNWGDAKVSNRVLEKCIKLLKHDNLVACSDGSVNFERSAHAWGLACKRKKQLFFTGRAPVDGMPHALNSTRAEILGILACVTFIQWISLREDIRGKHITLYTDSEAAILCSSMQGLSSTKYALYNDIDVIIELQAQLKASVNKIHLAHVAGHQDKSIKFHELSPEARLNVLMDKTVGLFIEANPKKYAHSLDAPHLPSQKLCLSGNKGTITASFRDTLIDQFNQPVYDTYMKKHFGEPSSTGANWKHLARVLKTEKKNRSKNTKMLHNQYNTFDVCHRWKTSDSPNCPLCKADTESWDHLPRCQHVEIRRVCNVEINRIRRAMRKVKTDPQLETHLLTCIRAYTENRPIPTPQTENQQMIDAHNHQKEIRWTNFMKGIWSDKWERIQHQYYCSLQEKNNNLNIDVWCKRMVATMFSFFRILWKERCEINQAQKSGTLESRIREKTYAYCRQLQNEIWKFHQRDRHLIRQSRHFFQHSSIQQILAWEKRINGALKRERDARKNMTLIPLAMHRPRNVFGSKIGMTSIVNTTRTYKQTLLSDSLRVRTSTSASGGNGTTAVTRKRTNLRQHREIRRQNRYLKQVRRTQQKTIKIQSVLTNWMIQKSPTVDTRHEMEMSDAPSSSEYTTDSSEVNGTSNTVSQSTDNTYRSSTGLISYNNTHHCNDDMNDFEEQCKYYHENIELNIPSHIPWS